MSARVVTTDLIELDVEKPGPTAGPALMVNRAAFPVTVLGPGVRAGVWVQGCTLACSGCMSTDTWSASEGRAVPVPELVAWLDDLPQELTGLTVSGGEPFQQPGPLRAFMRAVRAWSARREQPIDVMVYSGYTGAALRRSRARVAALEYCDVVVTGPFVRSRVPGGSWRGSANQRLEVLTELGEQRFGPDADSQPWRPGLQAVLDDGRWWLAGVPGPGQLARLERELAARGVELSDVSWDPAR